MWVAIVPVKAFAASKRRLSMDLRQCAGLLDCDVLDCDVLGCDVLDCDVLSGGVLSRDVLSRDVLSRGVPCTWRSDAAADLARAMAVDTLAVVRQTPGISHAVVVSADPEAIALAHSNGLRTVHDRGGGLNDAVIDAVADVASLGYDHSMGPRRESEAERVPRRAVHADQRRAFVLPTDLVGLDAVVLSAALLLAAEAFPADSGWFVADAQGRGTTLLGMPVEPGTARAPLYGADSAHRHLAAGFGRLDLPPDLHPARRDVDTWAALEEARRRTGTGPAVRSVLRDLLAHACPAGSAIAVR